MSYYFSQRVYCCLYWPGDMRSGYGDDLDNWSLIRWRGAVASAIRGKRGQLFLKELAEALDNLPEKALAAGDFKCKEGVCALGAVGLARDYELDKLPVEEDGSLVVAQVFGIADALVREIEWMNDESFYVHDWREVNSRANMRTRWTLVRDWVKRNIL